MSYRKTKGFTSNVVLMLVLLAAVIIIMVFINKRKTILSDLRPSLEQFDGAAAVVNKRYMNRPFRFAISAPDTLWHFSYSPDVKFSLVDSSEEFNPTTVVHLSRDFKQDTVAVIDVGVFLNTDSSSLEQIATRSLRDVVERYKTIANPVTIVGNVTIAGSANLSSSYYVVELPSNTPHPYPVWVVMFVIQEHIVYRINCQVRRESYEEFRTDFETVLKSFSFI